MRCLFCDFVKNKKSRHQKKQYSVIPIFETKNVFSFLSPPNNFGDSELLVIPKKHYEFVVEVKKKILHELIDVASSTSEILRKKYTGATILLNDGHSAEQWIPHVHFHVIPKIPKKQTFYDKNVGKNPWKNLSVKEFIEISYQLKQDFKTLKKVKVLN